MQKRLKLAAASGLAAVLLAGSASAAVVTYHGFDSGANAPGANALAAAAAFDAATNATIIDFEAAGLPAGVTLTGGGVTSTPSGTPANLYGENTTAGGDRFLNMYGGAATFTFAAPISAFGAFFGGLQVPSTAIVFLDDGGSQSVTIGGTSGGFAFVGFTDFGQSITSVTINATNDILSVDDVRFGGPASAGVPEPGVWALMLAGFGLAGAAIRNRRRVLA